MPTTNTRSSLRTRRTRSGNGGATKSASGAAAKSSNGKKSKPENGAGGNSQLEKLFTDSLKDIYWAEKHLTKALPKMKKAATTDELKSQLRNILPKPRSK